MRASLTFLAALALSAGAAAHEFKLGTLEIHHPWARATPPGQGNGAVYLKINNAGGQPDALVAASVGALARAELHAHLNENGVMKMRPVERVAVPAKGSALLKPGGDHVMLIGLKRPLKEGDKLPLTLRFEKAGEVKVEIKVEPLTVDAESLHAGH
ncbi:copper chaperone PCu(A)C [Chitinimonas koreensis]|uniref:copper chaperone PCu(A)C n=1 Tax=Chitinimonas koreensis TaxID=356302 RepID=UPI000427047F|nr:copper chaperone PCu(A)C [Chitinimonas koreensis]QNM98325.1 copper chaperone PCu(A)C [Chitinimonas koreensis]